MKLELGQRSIRNSNHLLVPRAVLRQISNREFQRAKAPITFDNRETGFFNHNYINIFKSDWLSTALIAAFNNSSTRHS